MDSRFDSAEKDATRIQRQSCSFVTFKLKQLVVQGKYQKCEHLAAMLCLIVTIIFFQCSSKFPYGTTLSAGSQRTYAVLRISECQSLTRFRQHEVVNRSQFCYSLPHPPPPPPRWDASLSQGVPPAVCRRYLFVHLHEDRQCGVRFLIKDTHQCRDQASSLRLSDLPTV